METRKRLIVLLSLIPCLTGCGFLSFDFSSSPYSYIPHNSTKNEISSEESIETTSSEKSSTSYVNDLSTISMDKTNKDMIQNSVFEADICPNTGNANLLVIPVWFSDSSNFITSDKKETVRSDINKTYFGSNEETGWRSVKTYYQELSGGKLNLTGTVSEWYQVDKSYKAYAHDDSGDLTCDLVLSATNWYFENHTGETRKKYDSDNNGYLDGVFLVYAAPDYQTLNNDYYDNLWAYCFWIQDYKLKNKENPGENVFFWASYDFMYSTTVAKKQTGNAYANGDTSHCNLDAHVFIHEMGHALGLEDYYDYSEKYNPCGGFSMQDFNVGSHEPFSCLTFGWADAYIPTESTTINLKPFQDSHECIILTPEWNKYNSPFDEYLLLEFYTPSGLNDFDCTYQYQEKLRDYPNGIMTSGIRLWHVDARLAYTSDGTFSPSKLTTNPSTTLGYVCYAMSNTYYQESVESYISPLGKSYANFNILQLIRNSTAIDYRPTKNISNIDLFATGDSFDMVKYKNQFYKTGILNSGLSLGFSFTVESITNDNATISIKKI